MYTKFVFLVVCSDSMGFASCSSLERLRTSETFELLVFVPREDFLTVDVMHLNMFVPALSGKHRGALSVRTAVMVFVSKIVFFINCA